MDLTERILKCRKQLGYSQMELAEKLNVSRQAISKWESSQATPDVERIVKMSILFHVSTDYLLKGADGCDIVETKEKIHGNIVVAIALAFVAIGFLTTIAIWHEWQTSLAFAIGFGLQIFGLTIYAIGLYIAKPETKPEAIKNFVCIGTWLLYFAPISALIGLVNGSFIAPYPIFSPVLVLQFAAVYFAASSITVLVARKRFRIAQNKKISRS